MISSIQETVYECWFLQMFQTYFQKKFMEFNKSSEKLQEIESTKSKVHFCEE
jgi:hypothetical protein